MAAQAEQAAIYGVNVSAMQGGGFKPAGASFVCAAIEPDGRCWDGHTWHTLYPAGPRHYARVTGQVDCRAITKFTGDCWDGHAWYKLPYGTLYGIVLPAWEGGAFRTTPLPPDAVR